MKLKKTTTITIVLLVLASTGFFYLPFSSSEYSARYLNYEPIDLGHKIRTAEYPIDGSGAIMANGDSSSSAELNVLDAKMWLVLDDYMGSYVFETFLLVAEGIRLEMIALCDVGVGFLCRKQRYLYLNDSQRKHHTPLAMQMIGNEEHSLEAILLRQFWCHAPNSQWISLEEF